MAFSAALEQIIRLQPNFINVWRFQAWNLSYNISVEFDDYHDRYYWVIKGINFIIGGTTAQQATSPGCSTTWAGSSRRRSAGPTKNMQYRKLFKRGRRFPTRTPTTASPGRTRQLAGRPRMVLEAQDVVDKLGMPVKGITPLVFHSYPSMA